jgi:hypothetical protein
MHVRDIADSAFKLTGYKDQNTLKGGSEQRARTEAFAQIRQLVKDAALAVPHLKRPNNF